MLSKKNKRGQGKLEGAHEVLTSVASAPGAGEALHNEAHAVDKHEATKPEDAVEGGVLDGLVVVHTYRYLTLPNVSLSTTINYEEKCYTWGHNSH